MNRKNLLIRVNNLQRNVCCYDGYRINKESHKPSFCDCKYGSAEDDFSGEETGCPELRTISHILSVMTEEEYNDFILRRNK